MSLLVDKTIKDFSSILASSEPAPGGGSTAALSGLLATSLTMMVGNLSFGKKSFEELDDAKKNKFRNHFDKVSQLNLVLEDLIDKDTEAFNLYMAALKMPKETIEERSKRMEKLHEASLYALNVPLEVAESCISVLRFQSIIAQYGNKNAISDVGVGALLAWAGLEGAILNVKINLPSISEESVKTNALKRIEKYQEESMRLKTEIMEIVDGRL